MRSVHQGPKSLASSTHQSGVSCPVSTQGRRPPTDSPNVERRTILGLALVVTLMLFASCSSSAPESLAFAEDEPVVVEPAAGVFTEEEHMLIDFHIDWLCELERRTFTTLEASDELLAESLRSSGVAPETYETFVRDTLSRQEVRDAVLFGLLERCQP